MAGNDPDGRTQGSALVPKLDEVGEYFAVFPAPRANLIRQAEALGSSWTDERGVVPGELGQRLWQLLQPTVVGKAAVEDRRVGLKTNFQRVSCLRLWVSSFGSGGSRCRG